VNRFRTIAVTAVAGIALVACGSSASSSPPAQSTAPSVAPSQAQPSAAGVLPSFTAGAVADLEALIPDKVGALTMTKQSMAGSAYLTSGQTDPATVKFLQDLGVSPSDISVAVGFGFTPDGKNLVMFVMRAAGADTDRLISVFKAADDQSRDTPLTWNTTTVSGKQVQVAVDGDTTIYLYAKDDVLIFISGDAASTQEAIGGLP